MKEAAACKVEYSAILRADPPTVSDSRDCKREEAASYFRDTSALMLMDSCYSRTSQGCASAMIYLVL